MFIAQEGRRIRREWYAPFSSLDVPSPMMTPRTREHHVGATGKGTGLSRKLRRRASKLVLEYVVILLFSDQIPACIAAVVFDQTVVRNTSRPCVEPPDVGIREGPLSLQLELFQPVLIGLSGRLLLHQTNQTLALDATQHCRIGI